MNLRQPARWSSGPTGKALPNISSGAQELDRAVEEALSCPCVDDLKNGPCGKSFVAAFGCFIRSTADEKARRCAVLLACSMCLLARPQLHCACCS